MFKRLAKSGLVKFWPVQPQRIAQGLHRAELSNRSYSNDNLPGFRHPAAAGKRRSRTPALACHWFNNRNGRLECRWQVADEAPTAGFDERRHSARGRPSGRSPRSRNLALAGPAVSAEDFT
jgi:hypothetical protein